MKIREGSSRVTFMFERFTVKVAQVPIGSCAGKVLLDIKRFMTRNEFYKSTGHGYGTLSRQLLNNLRVVTAGIEENFWEFYGTIRLRGAVVPAWFSFLGVLNISDKAHVPIDEFSDQETELILGAISPFVDVKNQFTVWRTFLNPRNFGVHAETLKLLEFGEKDVVKLLLASADVGGRNIRGIDALQEALGTIQRSRDI